MALHDVYVICYSAAKNRWKRNLLPRSEKQNKNYKNPDNDPRGLWRPNNLAARNYYSKGTYPITTPSGRVIDGPPRGSYWRVSEEKFRALDRDNRIWWGKNGDNIPAPKIFLSEVKDGVVPMSLWHYSDAGHTQEAKKELIELVDFLSSDDVFITPKPTRLIQRILQIASDGPSIILNSFAGSGTTAHAVLKQNAADGGERKFILVEMEPKIAEEITAKRVRRVIEGYTDSKGKAIEGLGGGFQYCRLSEQPLFNAYGAIRDDVRFAQLAEFVWFVETGTGYTAPKQQTPLLGVHEGRAIYLLYNGILQDRSDLGGNVLNQRTLAFLERDFPHDGLKTIYGARCRYQPARLKAAGIEFKQLPYRIQH